MPWFGSPGCWTHLLTRASWRRGLELTLAEIMGLGAQPPGIAEQLIAGIIAQRLLLCMPLLRRSGMLAQLGLETLPHVTDVPHTPAAIVENRAADTIDDTAATTIANLGGGEFL